MNYKLPLQNCALSSLMVTITPTMVLPTNPSNTTVPWRQLGSLSWVLPTTHPPKEEESISKTFTENLVPFLLMSTDLAQIEVKY